jgi:transposase
VRRAITRQYLGVIRAGPWETVRQDSGNEPVIEVQLLPNQEHDGVSERWLLCRSAGCQLKERQMFAARLGKARANLTRLQAAVATGTFTSADVIQRRAQRAVGRTHDLRGIFCWELRSVETRQELVVQENTEALAEVGDLQGVYLLRTTSADLSAADLWHTYMLLTRVEAAFRNLKTDLCLRPNFHSKEERADAHVLFAVLAYAMSITVQLRHRAQGGELTTAALLEKLERVQLAELSFGTTDGNRMRFERVSVPTVEQQAILESLGWTIPEQYLPPNLGTEPARL